MEIKYYIGGSWRSICSNDIRIYKSGVWKPVVAGQSVNQAGSWIGITCPVFGNEVQSQDFTKVGCAMGTNPSTVTYTVPANTYFSDSVADANTLALADITANGQNYANTNGYCFAPTEAGIIVVDFLSTAPTMDIFAYIDTVGVDSDINQQLVYTGQNYLPLTGTLATAADCYLLASDQLVPSFYRFEFNIGKLLAEYPSINDFIFRIQARASTTTSTTINYNYQYGGTGHMTMVNSGGLLVCSVAGATLTAVVANTLSVPSGRNGVYNIGNGAVIATFTYDRTAKTLTQT